MKLFKVFESKKYGFCEYVVMANTKEEAEEKTKNTLLHKNPSYDIEANTFYSEELDTNEATLIFDSTLYA